MTPRMAAVVTVVVLGVVAVAAILLLVPWGTTTSATAGVTPDATIDFSTAEIALGDRLARLLVVPGLLSMGAGLLLTLALGLTPLGARIAGAVARPLGGGWAWQVLLGGLVLLLVVRLLTLPFGAWAQSVRLANGLATNSWGAWLVDVAKAFGIATLITVFALLALVATARRWPHWWWVAAALGAAALVVAVSFLYPVLVEPVFNRFTPMADGPLRTSLLDLAHRDGIEIDDVLVADASRRTTTLNAYVSGLGGSRRIVVYDTLLQQAPDAEVESVVAHELGHVTNHDVMTGTLLGALGAAVAVVLLYLLSTWAGLMKWVGVSGIGDGRSVAFLLAFVAAASFVSTPMQSAASRQIEARADVHALNLTRDPETFAQLQHRLAVTAKADVTPNWLLYRWFGTHPTSTARLAGARSWAEQHQVAVPPPLAPTQGETP